MIFLLHDYRFLINNLFMDRKQTSIRLNAETLKKLKILAVENDKSLNEILLESIQDLLKKYGKPKK